mmetsp:Transcript_43819/g.78824  ORF Transcript_43819/g.78824 Transcript_43819/m.78824 type:complete len:80 (-) Transcript_43819:112-351(-)
MLRPTPDMSIVGLGSLTAHPGRMGPASLSPGRLGEVGDAPGPPTPLARQAGGGALGPGRTQYVKTVGRPEGPTFPQASR